MSFRQLGSAPIVFSIVGLFGCNDTNVETTQQCIERFKDVGSDLMATRNGELVPTFTYDVSEVENAFGNIDGGRAGMVGAQMTASSGPSGPALDAFYREDVPTKGAGFAGEGISLYRIKGSPGPRTQTIIDGCRTTPEKGRLIHIAWTPEYEETSN
ncbi:hypothetical protein LCM19_04480 [Qipengyuania flava]|nr:hypothetical protein [Qipengyuania flava]